MEQLDPEYVCAHVLFPTSGAMEILFDEHVWWLSAISLAGDWLRIILIGDADSRYEWIEWFEWMIPAACFPSRAEATAAGPVFRLGFLTE